jgi:hypothetical protein
MAWDKLKPDGSKPLKIGDDVIRANNYALEVAIAAEHVFATGGDQTGRHKFGRGTSGTRDAITEWVDGSIWYNTDTTDLVVAQVYNGSTWDPVAEYLDVENQWAKTQFGTWTTKTGTTVNWDLSEGQYFDLTLSGNTTINFPTLPTDTSQAASFIWRIRQATSGGPHTLAWEALMDWRWAEGIPPVISTSAGEVTQVMFLLCDDRYLEGSFLTGFSVP